MIKSIEHEEWEGKGRRIIEEREVYRKERSIDREEGREEGRKEERKEGMKE